MSGDRKDLLTELGPPAVEARYPEHKDRMRELLDRGLGESILERTREILGWIRSKLSK